jgi:HK97 family phage portal protein
MTLEDPAQPLLPPSALFESLGLGRSDAGVMINEKQAMRITTAQVCIRVISEDLASTGHDIIQVLPDKTYTLALNHRLWNIIHDRPNDTMSAKVFWGVMLANSLAWGNGYAHIVRDNSARVIRLVPLAADRTAPVKVNGKLMYATTQTNTGDAAHIDAENILHFMGLSFDGLSGISPIQSCKNAFGLASAAEKFGAQFFGSGARATGVLSHPNTLETEAYENLRKSVREWATGENALRPIILEEGMKWEQITVNPNDAQFLATRQFQKDEIAGLYRVPLHMVGSLLRATNNNIEHQSLDYIRYCLRPWAVGIEQEVNYKLLKPPFFMEHNLNDMQRGDFASQTAGYQVLRNIGVYSADDILRKMRENPIGTEAGGDIRTVQGAMIALESLLPGAKDESAAAADSNTPDSTQPFDRLGPAFRSIMADAIGRVLNSNRDPEFIRKTFRSAVIATAQAALAMRFGNPDLTARDLEEVNTILDRIVDLSAEWKVRSPALADRLANMAFSKFAG